MKPRYLTFVPAFLMAAFLLIAAQANSLIAQDTATAETAAETTASEAASGDVASDEAEAATESAPAASGGAKAEWETVFGQWKDILTRMRAIQTEYQLAEQEDMEKLTEEWSEKVKEGQTLMPKIRSAAIAAQKESPNSDRELTRFLIKMLEDEINNDNYEAANELGSELVTIELGEKKLNNFAGIAAFGVADFARAEELLTKAEADGSLAGSGGNFLNNIRENPDLPELWKAEQELRTAEAAAEDANKLPRVKMETDAGDFVIELFENEAPETVGNFINLVEKGYYDDLNFHRVMSGFMAQGGCPNGNGQGGPGYKIYCECILENHRNHWRGSLSMAKTSARNTGGSQFFFNFVPTPHLNGDHTVFGRIVEGMDNLAKIEKRDPEKPNAPFTKIIRAEVLNKRDHEYVPNKVQ